jgi:uncharacterized protein YjbJ (UPF0337 family)
MGDASDREDTIVKIGNVDLGLFRGFLDKFFGLQKELVGTVIGNDRLSDEGKAQQEKGTKQLKALRAEAEADKARTEAKVQERRQRTATRAKQSA